MDAPSAIETAVTCPPRGYVYQGPRSPTWGWGVVVIVVVVAAIDSGVAL